MIRIGQGFNFVTYDMTLRDALARNVACRCLAGAHGFVAEKGLLAEVFTIRESRIASR